ncbi:MAG: hypothetical protein PHG85_03505 [Candidatus Altiarchaeota archaeon]|nr:hypothetical protein [Candidatus Altiarchaeota archaeon]
MTLYLNERLKVVLDNKQKVSFLGFMALVYVVFINLPIFQIQPQGDVLEPFDQITLGLSILFFNFTLLYGLFLVFRNRLVNVDKSIIRKIFWVVVGILSLLCGAGLGGVYHTGIIETGLLQAISTLFLLYLSEKVWEYGFNFGVEFFLAISAFGSFLLELFNPFRDYNGRYAGLVFGSIEELFGSGNFTARLFFYSNFIATLTLIFYIVFFYVTARLMLMLYKKIRRNGGASVLYQLSSFVPVYIGLIAAVEFVVIAVVIGHNGITIESLNPLSKIAGMFNPFNGFDGLTTTNFVMLAAFLITAGCVVWFISRVYTIIWCKLALKRDYKESELRENVKVSFLFTGLCVMAFLIYIPLSGTIAVLLLTGVAVYLFEDFKRDEKNSKTFVVIIMAISILGYILPYLWDLLKGIELIKTVFSLVTLALIGWFTMGPYSIFKKISTNYKQEIL